MDSLDIDINELIRAAQGVSELARKMGYDPEGGRQRINGWRRRQTIPQDVLRRHGKLFRKLIHRYRRGVV